MKKIYIFMAILSLSSNNYSIKKSKRFSNPKTYKTCVEKKLTQTFRMQDVLLESGVAWDDSVNYTMNSHAAKKYNELLDKNPEFSEIAAAIIRKIQQS